MRKILTILTISVLHLSVFAYTPPIGIPDPGAYWSTLHPIDTANPDTTTHCPGWHEGTPRANSTAGGDARNCYYIDSAAGCTDSSNVYGYPGSPRCTAPAKNPLNAAHGAGTYFQIYGGAGRSAYTWTPSFGEGTAASPIWVVGKNSPVFSGTVYIGNYYESVSKISYIIMDGLYLTGRLKVNLMQDGLSYDHICLRNGTIAQSEDNQGSGMTLGTDRNLATWSAWESSAISDFVVYGNDIGPIGVKTVAHRENCGILVGPKVTRLFVLNNDVHDAVEDGIAGGHGAKRSSSYIYVGDNRIFDNMTNAIDFKQLSNVIISSNDISAYKYTDEGDRYVLDEGLVVLHYAEDTPGSGTDERYKNYPDNIWFINNQVHDADYGVVTSSIENFYVVGNAFYNVKHDLIDPATVCTAAGVPNKCCTGEGTGTGCPTTWSASTSATGAALKVSGLRGELYVVNNSVYDCDGGMMILSGLASAYNAGTTYYRAYTVSYNNENYYCINDDGGTGISGISPTNSTYWTKNTYHITDNIVSSRAELTFFDYALEGVTTLTDFNRNLVYNSAGSYIYWGASTQRNMAYVHDNSAFCATEESDTCYEADPKFVNTVLPNLSLQADSPAIDKADIPSGVYALFNTNYSLSIQTDGKGTVRPQNGSGDLGSYEYSTDETAPTLTSITIGTNGTSWTFAYNEAVTCASTANCCQDYTAAMTTAGAVTLSYSSGSGTSSVVCTGSPSVDAGDTVANGGVDYTTREDGIEDAAGNDLATRENIAVTNNSELDSEADIENPVVTMLTAEQTIYLLTKTIVAAASDDVVVTSCKWRIGSAPDGSNGTACSGTDSVSCNVTGLTPNAANTVYVGCTDGTNWGSDSVSITTIRKWIGKAP